MRDDVAHTNHPQPLNRIKSLTTGVVAGCILYISVPCFAGPIVFALCCVLYHHIILILFKSLWQEALYDLLQYLMLLTWKAMPLIPFSVSVPETLPYRLCCIQLCICKCICIYCRIIICVFLCSWICICVFVVVSVFAMPLPPGCISAI